MIMLRALTAAIMVAVAMAGVVLVRATREEDGGGAAANAPSSSLWDRMQAAAGNAPVQEGRAALRRAFGAARQAPERVPATLQARVRASLGVPPDVRFENGHRLRTRHGRLWLTDLARATCIVKADDGALACDTTRHVARRGLVLTVYAIRDGRPRDFVLFGLAPDRARRARLRDDERVRDVAVRDNAYAATAAGPIRLDRLLRQG
jgi:hypothetical protein